MKVIIMLASHEILPSRPPQEETAVIDLSAGYSLRERWDMSGDTFPARALNSICRLVYRRTRMDFEALACDEYYAGRPRTVKERLGRIRAALNPNLLLLQVGHMTSDFEIGLTETIEQLRNNPSLPEEE